MTALPVSPVSDSTAARLPCLGALEYPTQKALHAFVLANCRHACYDARGHEIPGGTVLDAGLTGVCASCAILFAQALRDSGLAEMREERDELARALINEAERGWSSPIKRVVVLAHARKIVDGA